jgi:hypothetical protein
MDGRKLGLVGRCKRERKKQQFGIVGCTKMVSKLAWDMKEESFNFEI